MAIGISMKKAPPPLADVLVERKPLPVAQCIKIAAAILNGVRRLHTAGSFHGHVDLETVRFDPTQGQLALLPPGPTCEFGGLDGDPNLCPPELQGAEPIVLSTRIDEAEAVLAAAGLAIAPRGIDLHQVAALLAHLLTGMPLSKYLRNVKVKALVPATLQSVLERGLAFRPSAQFRSCDEFLNALNAVAQEQGIALRLAPTPSTPAVGKSAPTSRPVDPVAAPPSAPAPSKTPPTDEPPAESDLPFTRLGHYRLVRRLGRGGMGDVYLGHEAALERMVAIKVLPGELGAIEDFVRRFQLEASAVARLNHPNIVPVHFIGHDAGRHFFAMQFVEGQSLEQLLREKGKLPVAQAVGILRQCLAGLGEAHLAGLVHRDVKPANILLETKTGRALVADFGLVKSMSRSGATLTGVVLGTVDYIAPEQARGKDVDGRADLYALGVMSYQMLSGRLPFDADSASAMIFQHAYEPPPPLREVAPELPEALTRIVERLLMKDPELRYRSCEEVLADLQPLSGHTPQETAPWRPSRIVRASEIDALPVVPANAPPPRREGWFEALGRKLRAKAPQALRQLQSTSLQMDDALADYEERRGQVARLVEEGRQAIGQLTAQAQACRAGAIAADNKARSAETDERREALRQERLDNERTAGDLEAQATEQRDELEQLELILARATADLGRLRAQRDLLQVRLRSAEAEMNPAPDPRRRRKRTLGTGAAVAAGMFGLGLVVCILMIKWLTFESVSPPMATLDAPTTSGPFPAETAALKTLTDDYQMNAPKKDEYGHVTNVDLQGTRFDDQALAVVGQFLHMEGIVMQGSSITDQGLEKLPVLRNLARINIISSGVTDRGLLALHKMPSLKDVWLIETDRLTPSGMESLQKALPGIRLHVMNLSQRKAELAKKNQKAP
jgi:uncharacterized coiled-coil protein SlyX